MSLSLSNSIGVFYQAMSTGGLPLNAGLLYTYAAGSSTPQATFADSAGTPNANPIVLQADGRVTSEIWLTDGIAYRMELRDSLNNVLKSQDNITGTGAGAAVLTAALAAPGGSGLSGYLSLITSAVATTVEKQLQQKISFFDAMTAAQIADVRARTETIDVSAACQLALDYASLHGAEIDQPAGLYSLGTALIPFRLGNGGTKIKGAGPGTSEFKLRSTIANTAAQVIKTPTGGGYHNNLVLEDFSVNGNKSAITPSGITEGEGSGIYIDQVDGFAARNVWSYNCVENGWYIVNGTKNFSLDAGCRGYSNGRAGATAGRGWACGVTCSDFIIDGIYEDNKVQGGLLQAEGGSDLARFIIRGIYKGNGNHGVDVTDNVFSGVATDVYIRNGIVDVISSENTGWGVRLSENATAIGGKVGRMIDVTVGGEIYGNTSGGVLVQSSADGIIERVSVTAAVNNNGGPGVQVTGALTTDTRIVTASNLANSVAIADSGTRTMANAPLAWTPSEATIGALAAGTVGTYEVHGRMCIASAYLVWPATGNAADTVINGLPLKTNNAEDARQCHITHTSVPIIATYIIPVINSLQSILYKADGATRAKNSEMSGQTIRASWVYPIA